MYDIIIVVYFAKLVRGLGRVTRVCEQGKAVGKPSKVFLLKAYFSLRLDLRQFIPL